MKASGWKSLPSCPSSMKTGTKDKTIIIIEKKTARPTCLDAAFTTSRRFAARSSRGKLRQLAIAVFHHYHACVHQYPDSYGYAAKGHDIGGDARYFIVIKAISTAIGRVSTITNAL